MAASYCDAFTEQEIHILVFIFQNTVTFIWSCVISPNLETPLYSLYLFAFLLYLLKWRFQSSDGFRRQRSCCESFMAAAENSVC